MTPCIIIITDKVAAAVTDLGDSLKGFRRCRMAGTLDGKPVRFVNARVFPNNVRGIPVDDIRVMHANLTPQQEAFIHDWKASLGL